MAELVDPWKCTMDGPGVLNAEVGKLSQFSINIPYTSDDQPRVEIMGELISAVDGSTVEVQVVGKGKGIYEGAYSPIIRGRHYLNVKVNGEPIFGSPFSVFVTIPPTDLRNPVRIIGEVTFPVYITFNSNEQIIVSEGLKGLAVLDKQGTRMQEIEMKKKDGLPRDPMGVTVDEEDSIYVVEREGGCISKYDKNGKHLRSSAGKALNWPWGLRLIHAELYVCDTDNHQILVFDKEELVQSNTSILRFNHPADLATDEKGNVYVATGINRIQAVTPDGQPILPFGAFVEVKSPVGICFDHRRRIFYVVEQQLGRVSVYTPNGEIIYSFCKEGNKEGELRSPMGIAIDGDGFVYVCDSGNNRIQVF